jgi:hypothetical protein
MSWRRFHVLVMHLPPEAASVIATNPAAAWTPAEYLLATIADLTAAGNWQRAGKKNAPRPKPIERPGVKLPGGKKFGTESMSIAEMQKRLDKHNRGGGRGRRTRNRVHQSRPVGPGAEPGAGP